MTKEYVSITYENNIFYCTKNNTKWISVDGEKWYGEEKRIVELENKIADIKANCDLAIEGRDIKIKELEQQIEKMKRHCNCKHRDSEGYCEVKRTYLIDLSYDGCDKKGVGKLRRYRKMNDLKGIIEDIEKSSLVSDKVIKKVIEILGQENWNYINDEESDICTTAGELIITLKGIPDLETENAELKHTIAELRRDKDVLNIHTKAQEKLAEYRGEQLIKAIEIIKDLLEYSKEHWLYSDIKKQAEQFIKEIEK